MYLDNSVPAGEVIWMRGLSAVLWIMVLVALLLIVVRNPSPPPLLVDDRCIRSQPTWYMREGAGGPVSEGEIALTSNGVFGGTNCEEAVLTFEARGTPYQGVYPHVRVTAGIGKQITSWDVTANWNAYTIRLPTGGWGVSWENDLNGQGEDRNLFVRDVQVR